MARTTERLTAVEVKNLKTPGMHPDGNGLYLKVTKTGTKSWIFRFKRGRVAHDMGLGPATTVSLAKARKLASEARQKRLEGQDPIEARRAAEEPDEPQQGVTFKKAAEDYIDSHEAGWRNSKHRQQWRNTLKVYAYPTLGALPVDAVNTDHVLKVLQQPVLVRGKRVPLWTGKAETANRVRGRIEAVLSAAKARGLRSGENPAQWRSHLDQLLPPRAKVQKVRHHRAIPYAEIPEFMTELRALGSVSAKALEFTLLMVARTTETRLAVPSEFDRKAKLWTIPPERMKAEREHRVPLSDAALAIVKEMDEVRVSEFVFPGLLKDQPLSDMAQLECLRGLRPGYTVHGLRSSFRDWAAETTHFANEVVEMALAHVVKDKTEAAYRRGDLLERRRELMDAWARFCGRQPAKVLPMRRKAV